MHIEFLLEFELQQADKAQISSLLQRTFPNSDYGGKTYFKQLPHYRLVAREGNSIVGHVAMDYRVMNMAGMPIYVIGVIDLVVDSVHRNKGVATQLMHALEERARIVPGNVDFVLLVTDVPAYYERLGYNSVPLTTTWLKLYQHKNYGIGTERITDSHFMIKQIGDTAWQGEELDLLGYMY